MTTKTDALHSRFPDIDFQPLFARLLPEWVPERRNLVARKALLSRVRGEFQEMPGLSLTLAQATRLLGLSPEACARVLDVLVSEGLVRQRSDGRYVSAVTSVSRARSA